MFATGNMLSSDNISVHIVRILLRLIDECLVANALDLHASQQLKLAAKVIELSGLGA